MTTVRDTLTRAIRMTGARPLGDDPEAAELDVGLDALQAMLDSLVALGGPLTDVLISANYTAGENERITKTAGTETVTRPTTVIDSKTGASRAPRNGAVIEVCGTSPTTHVYCAQLASWMPIKALTLDSDQPFGPEHDEGLAAMVAVRVGPDLQQPNIPQWVVAMAEQGRRTLRQRLRQPYTATTDPLLLSVFQRCGTAL